jgi:hypothetical protein
MAMKSCLAVFGLYYVLGTLLSAAVAFLVKLNVHLGISIVVLIVAAHVAVHKFIHDNGRAPDKREKWRLAGGSLAIVIFLALITPVLMLLAIDGMRGAAGIADVVRNMTLVHWFIMLLAWVIQLLVLLLVYGWWSRKYAEKWVKPRPA